MGKLEGIPLLTRMSARWLADPRGPLLLCGWTAVATSLTAKAFFRRMKGAERRKAESSKEEQAEGAQATPPAEASADTKTRAKLGPLLRLAVPSKTSSPARFAMLLTIAIWARLDVSIRTSKLIGTLGQLLVARKWKHLFSAQITYALWCLPAAFLNSLVAYCVNRLAESMRGSVCTAIHKSYCATGRGQVQVVAQVEGTDKKATDDVRLLTISMAELFTGICKPTLEVILLSRSLAGMMGTKQLLQCYGYFFVSAFWVRMVAPRVAAATAKIASLEGLYRGHHQRQAHYAEEIAFMDGYKVEGHLLDSAYHKLTKATGSLSKSKLVFGTVDQYTLRYLGILAAFTTMMPTIYNSTLKAQHPTEYFLTCLHLLVNVGMALKDLAMTHRKVAEIHGLGVGVERLLEVSRQVRVVDTSKDCASLLLEDVHLVSPDKQTLIRGLTFEVSPRQHMLIQGPNGSGKTTLFRALRGVTQPEQGLIMCPKSSFFLPQRCYILDDVSLRQQLLYPALAQDSLISDERLREVLAAVGLNHLLACGLDSTTATDGLSGGEQQRIGLARLALAAPAFAFLDEACSAIPSADRETLLEYVASLGITLVCIAHQDPHKLFKCVLRLSNNGSYQLQTA